MATSEEHEIARVSNTKGSKWMEFWFTARLHNCEDKNDYCCKSYMLWDLVEEAGLDNYILNHGFVDMIITWPAYSDRPMVIRKPGRPVGMTEQEDDKNMVSVIE